MRARTPLLARTHASAPPAGRARLARHSRVESRVDAHGDILPVRALDAGRCIGRRTTYLVAQHGQLAAGKRRQVRPRNVRRREQRRRGTATPAKAATLRSEEQPYEPPAPMRHTY